MDMDRSLQPPSLREIAGTSQDCVFTSCRSPVGLSPHQQRWSRRSHVWGHQPSVGRCVCGRGTARSPPSLATVCQDGAGTPLPLAFRSPPCKPRRTEKAGRGQHAQSLSSAHALRPLGTGVGDEAEAPLHGSVPEDASPGHTLPSPGWSDTLTLQVSPFPTLLSASAESLRNPKKRHA